MSNRHHASPEHASPPAPVYGGLPCVWMSAGLVAYKLCDRGFECDACPLDQAMRGARRGGAFRPVGVARAAAAVPTIDSGSDDGNSSRGSRVSILRRAAFDRGGHSDGGR